jgi:ribosomal protein L37AE/L43A
MNHCPCCSNLLLKHIRNSHTYWFCRSCWQEMPVMSLNLSVSLADAIFDPVSRKNTILLVNL